MLKLSRIATVLLLLCEPVLAADWPTWLGPNRDGKSAETGLLKSWPEGGPKSIWKVKGLGEGYSSLAVVGNRIYTQGQEGDQQFVLALDTATGKQVWKTPAGKAFNVEQGGGPRGMPIVDGNRLYALASEGTLVCRETETGKRVWGFNYIEKFGSTNPRWGFSESPLVEGDRLIINPGGKGAGIVALNKATGAVIWQSQDGLAGYSSVLAFDFGGHHIYTVLTNSAAIGVDAKDGSLLWHYEKVVNRTANVATPVYADGYVFYSSDYNAGCALLKLTAEGGKVTAAEAYYSPDMQNHYTTSILIGDYLYGFSGNQPGILTAMEFKTGKLAWKANSIIGRLYAGQWSSPAVGTIGGVAQVVIGEGDGWVRGYEAHKGAKLWEFNTNPKGAVWPRSAGIVIATPVIWENKVYIANGQDPESGLGPGHLYAIDATKLGDITATGLIWHYGDMKRSISSVAIHNGLLFAADLNGFLHCLDVNTGKAYWTHDTMAAIWASPMVIDDKVYLGNADGEVIVLDAAKEKKLLFHTSMGSSVYSTFVPANGMLFITNRNTLFALANK